MILELKIKNFLSFKDEVTFSFEATADTTLDQHFVVEKEDGTRILKMMMIYGANASGKSNLLSVFDFVNSFFSNIPEDKNETTAFIPFRFTEKIVEFGEFELTFYVGQQKYKYLLALSEQIVKTEKLFFYPGTQPAILFSREYDEKKRISVVTFGSKIKLSEQATEAIQLKTLNNSSVFAAYNQVNVSIPLFDAVMDWVEKQFLHSIDPYTSLTNYSDSYIKSDEAIKKQALQFLKEADFNISNVLFKDKISPIPDYILNNIDDAPIPEEEKKKIKQEKAYHYDEKYFEHSIVSEGDVVKYQLEADLQSQGTMRYYGLSAPFFLAIENNAFLPIDEIGSALHPLLVIHFIKEFLQRSNEAQLLFTTHNLSLLNEKDILRKDAIWFTDKKEDGSTDLYSMADFNFRKNLSFYNAYKIGKFGGIPNLS